ncbi:glycosyltransferase family 2 protein [Pedobacter cryoconitis]|uniref:Glycosyltransferase involved in cell wall biosynthesis n=1 Tax=Pedobacter cryoconitis TaxID=188932 RepID=A0A7X0J9H9_9SPHI|nr:glycosyltransferase [Pedobacter cryoconitis]MBB6502407.1 glycosyltransferase involved in cell wall biosynthesis [Pedobacter cryoconitis]
MAPVLSIIVPVYNTELYISRCIESIIDQVFTDFELLLINDGSPDNSGAICDDYALRDKRIHVYHQKNQGVSVARNYGLDKATGEFVIFIDSDDWIDPVFLENYLIELKEYPTQLIYQGLINEFKDEQTYLRLPARRYNNNEITMALFEVELRQCLGGACNKIFNRTIIEEYGIRFEPSLSYGEDKIFTLQYCQNINSITLLDNCNYHYNRTMENSLSNLHHPSEKLIQLIELEYDLFKCIEQKFNNTQFIEAVRGRYLSINKYALLSMYRPNVLKAKSVRTAQFEKINHFIKGYSFDKKFDRDVPKIVHYLIEKNSDFSLRGLMWMRFYFSSLYYMLRNKIK